MIMFLFVIQYDSINMRLEAWEAIRQEHLSFLFVGLLRLPTSMVLLPGSWSLTDPATDILQVETNKMEGVLFKEFKKRKKNEVVLCAFYCKILEIEVKLTQDSGTGKAEVFERNWSILCFALTHFRQRICSSTFPLPHSAPNSSMII